MQPTPRTKLSQPAERGEYDTVPLEVLMEQILHVLPEADFDTDNDGQIVIYTGYKLIHSDYILSFETFEKHNPRCAQ